MPSSFNGIGTTYYGQREFHADGTYLTTEWFIFFAIPVVPLRSIRLSYEGPGKRKIPIGFESIEKYLIYERVPLSWKQVLNTYTFFLFLAAWVAVMAWLFFGVFDLISLRRSKDERFPAALAMVAICCLPWLIPKLLARRAIRTAGLTVR
jgi:hypothetical protein